MSASAVLVVGVFVAISLVIAFFACLPRERGTRLAMTGASFLALWLIGFLTLRFGGQAAWTTWISLGVGVQPVLTWILPVVFLMTAVFGLLYGKRSRHD